MFEIIAALMLMASEPDRTTPEDLASVMHTKEGAFEAAKIFGDCSAYIDTLAEYTAYKQDKADPGISATIETLEGVARGARLVGTLALIPHFDEQSEIKITDYLDTVIETRKSYWTSIIFTSGIDNETVAQQSSYCTEFNPLQTSIIEEYRKSLYGGDLQIPPPDDSSIAE